MRTSHPLLSGCLCLIALCACTGEIGGSGSHASNASEPSGHAGGTGTGAPDGPAALLDLPSGAPVSARLHKLTAAEFANSVHDLLGADAPLSAVEPDNVVAGFPSVGAASTTMSPAGVGLYEAASGAATEYVFADPARMASVLACVPQSATDSACLDKLLTSFGRRAFRRPLTSDEISRFSGLASSIGQETGSNIAVGVRHALWAILQSPNFLYRSEFGTPSSAAGGRSQFSGFELASRLAAALWNSVPDDTLLDAAAAGTLDSSDGIRAQAERLLTDARAHRALKSFVDELYGARDLAEAIKDPALFPAWTPTLQSAMQEELERRVDDVVFGAHGDFLSLYDSKTTFVNAELAKLYGLPSPTGSGFQPATFPDDSQRAGLLGAGAILSAFALPQRTSPTARGKFVNASLLCTNIPPPPPGVPVLPAMPLPNQTLRERLTAHRTNPSCATCHSLMDPIGFGMDDFDSIGKWRSADNGQPLDTTGTYDGKSFDGLAALGQLLRQEPVAGPCFVSKVYENALGRAALEVDGAALDALANRFKANGNRADLLLLDVVASDAFRFVQPS